MWLVYGVNIDLTVRVKDCTWCPPSDKDLPIAGLLAVAASCLFICCYVVVLGSLKCILAGAQTISVCNLLLT